MDDKTQINDRRPDWDRHRDNRIDRILLGLGVLVGLGLILLTCIVIG